MKIPFPIALPALAITIGCSPGLLIGTTSAGSGGSPSDATSVGGAEVSSTTGGGAQTTSSGQGKATSGGSGGAPADKSVASSSGNGGAPADTSVASSSGNGGAPPLESSATTGGGGGAPVVVTSASSGGGFCGSPVAASSSVASGSGGAGGAVGDGGAPVVTCSLCSDALNHFVSPEALCLTSRTKYLAVVKCACKDTCAAGCDVTGTLDCLASWGASAPPDCAACLASASGCLTIWNDCIGDDGVSTSVETVDTGP